MIQSSQKRSRQAAALLLCFTYPLLGTTLPIGNEVIVLENAATSSYGGTAKLVGISMDTVDLTAYTGIINIRNDRSLYTVNGSTSASAKTEAYGILANVTGDAEYKIEVEARGATATASGGTSFAVADAQVKAYGIRGDFNGDFSGTITVNSQGGRANSSSSSIASFTATNYANGIYGNSVEIGNYNGNIFVNAISGLHSANGKMPITATSYVHGIYAVERLTLNATGGSIHAILESPAGYEISSFAADYPAYAIHGGIDNDYVALSNIDIIGNIELSKGTNNTVEFHNGVRLLGDITADSGRNNIHFRSGFFTPVGTVHIDRLLNNELSVDSGAGFLFEVSQDTNSPLNSHIAVDGMIKLADGALLSISPLDGLPYRSIMGNTYPIVSADTIDGKFQLDAGSLIEVDITPTPQGISVTPVGFSGLLNPAGAISRVNFESIESALPKSHHQRSRIYVDAQDTKIPPRYLQANTITYQTSIHNGSMEGSPNHPGYEWQGTSLMVDVDKSLGTAFSIGVTAGEFRNDLDGANDQYGGSSKTIFGALHLTHQRTKAHWEAAILYGKSSSDIYRIAPDSRHYQAGYSAHYIATCIGLDYDLLQCKDVSIGWKWHGTFATELRDQLQESQGPTPILIPDENNQFLSFVNELYLTGSKSIEKKQYLDWLAAINLRANPVYEGGTTSASIDGFRQRIEAPEPGTVSLGLRLGCAWHINPALKLEAYYANSISSDSTLHQANGGLSVSF